MTLTDSARVITYAPFATAAGVAVLALSSECQEPWASALNLLSVVICSMALGALLIAFPMPDPAT